ncbi:MAG: FumA C-terminus/TtdB family hydratase beta subunit [Oscillospiraceae bacterium]|jgi:fumarate hydratase subunit beta|nr:FumA C-terminus/TtdB family hydratase beta subunit [Oscillospiraceae bacterium]
MELHTDNLPEKSRLLRAGDTVLLSGSVYTARDAAHKKLFELLDIGAELPFELRGAVIYYAGPTPAKNGFAIGSCGPTTSARMNKFAPRLFALGLSATIGKGEVSAAVTDALKHSGAVYFCAIGGAGALIARHISAVEEIAFPELGCESVKRLTLDRLPLIVGVDSCGGSVFIR